MAKIVAGASTQSDKTHPHPQPMRREARAGTEVCCCLHSLKTSPMIYLHVSIYEDNAHDLHGAAPPPPHLVLARPDVHKLAVGAAAVREDRVVGGKVDLALAAPRGDVLGEPVGDVAAKGVARRPLEEALGLVARGEEVARAEGEALALSELELRGRVVDDARLAPGRVRDRLDDAVKGERPVGAGVEVLPDGGGAPGDGREERRDVLDVRERGQLDAGRGDRDEAVAAGRAGAREGGRRVRDGVRARLNWRAAGGGPYDQIAHAYK